MMLNVVDRQACVVGMLPGTALQVPGSGHAHFALAAPLTSPSHTRCCWRLMRPCRRGAGRGHARRKPAGLLSVSAHRLSLPSCPLRDVHLHRADTPVQCCFFFLSLTRRCLSPSPYRPARLIPRQKKKKKKKKKKKNLFFYFFFVFLKRSAALHRHRRAALPRNTATRSKRVVNTPASACAIDGVHARSPRKPNPDQTSTVPNAASSSSSHILD